MYEISEVIQTNLNLKVVFEEIFKKEAMKTVQLILKYGSDEHRQTVYDELKGKRRFRYVKILMKF